MKIPIFSMLLLFALPALAEPAVKVCKDEHGDKYYDNTRKSAANCKPVKVETLSVIPSPQRTERLPVSIGMSQDQVAHNWGKPKKIATTQTRSGVTEQWTYAGGVLTFANGVLEVIEK